MPAREMLGDLLLESGEPGQALVEFEAALVASPGRFGSLLGAARAAKLAKDVDTARGFYAKLVASCNQADGRRAELQEARDFLNHTGGHKR